VLYFILVLACRAGATRSINGDAICARDLTGTTEALRLARVGLSGIVKSNEVLVFKVGLDTVFARNISVACVVHKFSYRAVNANKFNGACCLSRGRNVLACAAFGLLFTLCAVG
jgi:hypothetical protein